MRRGENAQELLQMRGETAVKRIKGKNLREETGMKILDILDKKSRA